MKRFVIAATLATAAFSAGSASAAETISIVSGTRGITIASNGPVGQTFVATDSVLTNFGFQFASSISGQTTASVTFSLFAGMATSGTALATQTVALSGLVTRGGTTFYDVFTGRAGLVTGQTYTALLSGASSNLSLLFGPASTSTVDAYAPGALIQNDPLNTACARNTYCDANFRFTTAAATGAVPEPATWGMALLGFGLIGGTLRRRRRTQTVRFA